MAGGVHGLAFWKPVEAWLGRIQTLPRSKLSSLTARYETLFGNRSSDGRVPLIESDYLRSGASNPGYLSATLQILYSNAGFRFATPDGRTLDHISSELEFVSLMCREEAGAWRGGTSTIATRVLLREQMFLARHMSQWLPPLSKAIVERDDGLYAASARAARAMVAHDVDFVRVARVLAREASPPQEPAGPH